jgi:hypothetical protein
MMKNHPTTDAINKGQNTNCGPTHSEPQEEPAPVLGLSLVESLSLLPEALLGLNHDYGFLNWRGHDFWRPK